MNPLGSNENPVESSHLGLVGVGLQVALFIRPDINMTVAPVRNPVYVTLSDGTIRNTYGLRLRNKHGEARQFNLAITGDPDLNW